MNCLVASLLLGALVLQPAANGGPMILVSAGTKIAYTDEGKGEPVILIHGFTANSKVQWQLPGIARELAKTHRVICIDNRGHGASDKPHEADRYGIEMVNDVVRLMDHLKLERAHVVGYSMGAFITGKLLSLHPNRVRSATLGGAGWMDPRTPTQLNALADSLEKEKSLAPLLEFLTPEGKPKPTPEQIKQINSLLMSFNDPLALAAVARGMNQLAVPEEKWKGNEVPTLVLIGDLDPLKAGVEPLQKAKPNVEVEWLKGATHMDAFQKPAFTKKLIEFLGKVEAAERK